MTEDIQEELNAHIQEGCYSKQVNAAVSFNAIKNMAFELFIDHSNLVKNMEKMTLLFKMNPGFERLGQETQKRKKHPIYNLTIFKE